LSAAGCFKTTFTDPDQGGGDDGMGGSGGGGAPSDDQTGSGGTAPKGDAPTIVSVSPADGAKGVLEDDQIIITFSEAMDKIATQAAYSSANASMKAPEVTFAWNSAGTELTITPNMALPYKSVTDPNIAADTVAWAISTAAKDKSGDELGEAFSAKFQTLKRVTQEIARLNDDKAPDYPAGGRLVKIPANTYGLDPTIVEAGCGSSGGLHHARGFWTYGLDVVPANVQLESAQLLLEFRSANSQLLAAAWATLNSVHMAPVQFTPPLQATLTYYNMPFGTEKVLNAAAMVCDAVKCSQTIDDLANVQSLLDDRIAAGNRSQYGLKAPAESTNCGDTGSRLSVSGPLVLVYTYE